MAVARLKALFARQRRRRRERTEEGEGGREEGVEKDGNTYVNRGDSNGSSSSGSSSSNGKGRRRKKRGGAQKKSDGTLSTLGGGEDYEWEGEEWIEGGEVGGEEGEGGRRYRFFGSYSLDRASAGKEEMKGSEEELVEEEEEGEGEGGGILPVRRIRRPLSVSFIEDRREGGRG